MAIYVTADLHGFPWSEFRKLLDQVYFSEKDFLYILGDVVDRNNDGGIGFLREIMCMDNVELILGNHELMMLSASFLFDEITEETISELTGVQLQAYNLWMINGGQVTLDALQEARKEDPDMPEYIKEYLMDCPLYEYVETDGEEFVLVHAGLGHFDEDKDLDDYEINDLVWERPSVNTVYYEDKYVIIGHTPTALYGSEYRHRAFKTRSWMDIDTGSVEGGKPMLLRLDDMEEFYLI